MHVRHRVSGTLIAALAIATPVEPALAQSQDGPLVLAHFVRVDEVDVSDFEEAARAHAQWHRDQNDSWAWPIYQAMTGQGTEYVALSPNHSWADFDDPQVPMDRDLEHWIEDGGARFVTSTESVIWAELPDVSNSPADPPPPIVQVIEWEIQPGGEEAVMHGIGKYKEAVDEARLDFPFTWSRMVSREGAPRIFLTIWADSFAEWDGEGPNPMEIMTEAYGAYDAREIFADMAEAWTEVSSRIWVNRPDLSYTPGM